MPLNLRNRVLLIIQTPPQPLKLQTLPQPLKLQTLPQPLKLQTLPQPLKLQTILQTGTLNLRHYSNPSLGVTLQYPLGWSIGSVKGGVQIIKEKGVTFVDIRLNNLKSSVSDLKQYVDDDIADRKKSRSGSRLLMISHRPQFQEVCLHIRHLTAL